MDLMEYIYIYSIVQHDQGEGYQQPIRWGVQQSLNSQLGSLLTLSTPSLVFIIPFARVC